MKKLLLPLLFILTAFAYAPEAHAQFPTAQGALVSRYGKTLDTVTNTGLKNLTTPLRITGAGQSVTIGVANTILTGTMAAGVCRLYGSLDNIHFTRIKSTLLHGGQVDSLLMGATVLNYHWVVDNSPFTYFQVGVTGAGTVTFTTQGYFIKH